MSLSDYSYWIQYHEARRRLERQARAAGVCRYGNYRGAGRVRASRYGKVTEAERVRLEGRA